MAKKKKTREEKILADQRHVLYHLETSAAQLSFPAAKKAGFELNLATQRPALNISYAYVLGDIKKTAIITFSILTAQIILFFVLR